MAIVVKFAVTGMSVAKYEEVLRALEAEGLGAPKGRLYHVSYGDHDNLQVIDVYDSHENLGAFGEKLMPILTSLGVSAVPEPMELYRTIPG